MVEEVVAQILSRLPPRSLMRFKCVGKSWCALINNPGFISQHLYLYNKVASTPILIKRSLITRPESINEEVVFSLLHLHSDDDDDNDNCHSIAEDIIFSGLTRLILCNPAIKEFRIVEHEDGISFHVGFGYDPKTKDYVLINVMSNGRILYDSERLIIHPPRAKMYTLGTGSWREINTNYLETETTTFWPTLFQLYYKGIFYWFGNEQRKDIQSEFDQDDEDNSRMVIIFYDTGDELFHTLFGPDGFYDPNDGLKTMDLALLNESIAVYGFHCIGNCPLLFEIWTMVDFDVNDCSWTKHLAVVPPIEELYMPGALRKNSVILWSKEGRVVSYNTDKDRLKFHPIHGSPCGDFQVEDCLHSIVSVKGPKNSTFQSYNHTRSM